MKSYIFKQTSPNDSISATSIVIQLIDEWCNWIIVIPRWVPNRGVIVLVGLLEADYMRNPTLWGPFGPIFFYQCSPFDIVAITLSSIRPNFTIIVPSLTIGLNLKKICY